ncbi:parallel beta-helix domain-containing protein [Roseateles sp.]|uniref:parallel beta-helix domain-containing protein n=1 Tax=Roseateles sp. TaxID=1971397 RepID=UPI0039EC1024
MHTTLTLRALASLTLPLTLSAQAAVLTVQPGTSVQAAVIQAKPGDTIRVMPGVYRETVFIDKENITLQGVVVNGQWPVMDGGGKLNDGILASGHRVTIQKLWVKGYKGNGIMTQGANNYKILDNYVDGGFYGIFPQFGKNGLIARNRITRVEDAGIYVGMSDNADIIANEAWGNVIGIEAENSRDVLIEGNYTHDNASGMTITLIPGLPVKDAARTWVRNNFIINNNGKNFAPPSSAAANTPSGTGVVLVAVKDTALEGNIITGNRSTAVLTTDHATFGMANDPKVDPFPANLAILDNHFADNGNKPAPGFNDLLKAAGVRRADLVATGKERDSCITYPESITSIGTKRWKTCEPGRTTSAIKTAMLPEPVQSPALTLEQKGRLTYLAVCTGCHAYNTQLHGPSMLAVKALYQGNPEGLAKFAANPTRKRKDFAEMPNQDYLGADVLKAVANYILNDLKN